MKVEKLNKNKIKMTITKEDLKERRMTFEDIKNDLILAKALVLDALYKTEENVFNEEYDFIFDDSHLLIEATTANNNSNLILTITKIEPIPEFSKYSLTQNQKNTKNSKNNKRSNKQYKADLKDNDCIISNDTTKRVVKDYFVDSYIYLINNFDILIDMCRIFKKSNLFCGKNSLYELNGKYYLIFSKHSVSNKKFLKSFCTLAEYCSSYETSDIIATAIIEKSNLVILDKAIQTLKNY